MLAIMVVALLRSDRVVGRRFFEGVTYRMAATWRTRIADTYLAAPLSFHEAARPVS